MEILVCIKAIKQKVNSAPIKKQYNKDNVFSYIFNPYDRIALEAALQLKEKHKATVTLLSLGPLEVSEILREGLAMGADAAYRVEDLQTSNNSSQSIGCYLAQALQKVLLIEGQEYFDIILCGEEDNRLKSASVVQQFSSEVNIPVLIGATYIDVRDKKVFVRQKVNTTTFNVVEVPFPVLITADKTLNIPRIPTNERRWNVRNRIIPTLSAVFMGLNQA